MLSIMFVLHTTYNSADVSRRKRLVGHVAED